MSNTEKLDQMVANLKGRGVSLPRNKARARVSAASMHEMALAKGDFDKTVRIGSTQNKVTLDQIEENNRLTKAMGAGRRMKTAGGGGDAYAAIPRFYDPIEYWDLSGLPWNMADESHRHKLHKWLRLYYSTHYLVPALIDIFTRFPLAGLELACPDRQLKNFYEDLFLDQLDYPEFLTQLGREFWTVGEAFALGSFDETLGVWEREELLNPEDVVIQNFPLLGEKELKIVPPEYLKKLAQTKSPAKEYKMLQLNFPDILPYLEKNEHIPISGVLLKQIANKQTAWDDHGTPILLRGLRTLVHEEKLLASQDAIAERLYSPLIMAKLGVMDLGDGQGPWIPSPDELDAFRDDMDLALSSDFRLLVHHFGIEVENVFGREQMPRLGDDFDRIERRIMQIFGVNPSLLSAGSNSQPYASSALQAEFLNQVLRTFQNHLKRHYMDRAVIVAEAQEHYAYETRGSTRVPIMEEVVETDEEGNKHIVEKHKLLVPEMTFGTLDLRDEATERQFMQTLRAMGVAIPDQKLMIGVDVDISDYTEEYNDELVKKTVAQQEAKMKAYKALDAKNLPIPPDLMAEVQTVLNKGQGGNLPPAPAGGLPAMPSGEGPGADPNAGGAGGDPGEQIVMPEPPAGLGPNAPGGSVPGGGPPAAGPMSNGGGGAAPAISMERRPGAPTAPGRGASVDKTAANVHTDVEPLREEDRSDKDKTVIRLPKSASKKKYSFVDDPDV